MQIQPPTLSRRDAVKAAAWALAAAAIAPKLAFADEKTVAAEIKKLYGDKPMASGKIRLDVPEIAEDKCSLNHDFAVPGSPANIRERSEARVAIATWIRRRSPTNLGTMGIGVPSGPGSGSL